MRPMHKATAWCKLLNWSLAQLPPNKQPLLLNMDETACRLFYDPATGVLASELVALAARRGQLTQSASTAQTRSVLSLVALLCNDSSFQSRLPQYILGNEHVLRASVVGELRRDVSLLPNVHILRRKSAWVNDAELAAISRHWGRVLQDHCPDKQPSFCWTPAAHTWGPSSWQVAYAGRFGWCVCQRA